MCTFLTFPDSNGNAYKGRTMELDINVSNTENVVYYPKGTTVLSKNPNGDITFNFTTKYPIVGVEFTDMLQSGNNLISDGANNQGLTLSLNALPNSVRSEVPEKEMHKAMSILDMCLYVLGNLKTVDEVRNFIEKEIYFYCPKSLEEVLTLHFAFQDRSGKCIIFEYLDNGIQIYDNPVGVMTNAPEFPWHLKNLNNFAHLTNIDKNNGQFGDLVVKTPDPGAAMDNVPSSQISYGRFIKAAYFKTFVQKGNTPEEHIVLLGHIMNNFDRPANLTTDGELKNGNSMSEVTKWTILYDATRNKYIFRAINQLNYIIVDIDETAKSPTIQKIDYLSFTGFVN